VDELKKDKKKGGEKCEFETFRSECISNFEGEMLTSSKRMESQTREGKWVPPLIFQPPTFAHPYKMSSRVRRGWLSFESNSTSTKLLLEVRYFFLFHEKTNRKVKKKVSFIFSKQILN